MNNVVSLKQSIDDPEIQCDLHGGIGRFACLLGYDMGIGSGSTSPRARRIGGRVTSATGPIDPISRE